MERDPLYISTPAIQSVVKNKRGRPFYKEITRFGPQSKSKIIQEFMNKQNIEVVEDNETPKCEIEIKTTNELICETCAKRNISIKEHKKHIKSHKNSQALACDFPNCTYSCKLSCNLIKHRRVHTSEKPYICDQCPFRTNFVNSLKVHKRIHTSERPYTCQYCKYCCNSSSNLKKHCQHRHTEKVK